MDTGGDRSLRSLRSWPIASAPPALALYLLLTDIGVAGWAGFALRSSFDQDARAWTVLALLVALALLFEESATRTARMQRRLSGQLKRNMTSVWTVAGVVALPTAQAVLLVVAVVVYIWLRQQRPVGQQLYRCWFTASTQVAASLVSAAVLHTSSPEWRHLGWALGGSITVLLVIVIQTAVNRTLVTLAFLGVGLRGKALIGTRDDNLIELATLCLGGLVALAAAHEPWLCVLVIAPMITLQRGALVRELETAASIDAKTGLLNAVAWEQLATREIEHAQSGTQPLSVLIIDIDRFKLVNDKHGHLVGDEVLRGVGKLLAAEVREFDTVGRFGGEEFVAVLPGAGDADALVVAERLRSRINELRISSLAEAVTAGCAHDDTMAVSVGVACSPTDGAELADLLVAADGALYRAKAAGRNRVMLAERGTGGSVERIAHS